MLTIPSNMLYHVIIPSQNQLKEQKLKGMATHHEVSFVYGKGNCVYPCPSHILRGKYATRTGCEPEEEPLDRSISGEDEGSCISGNVHSYGICVPFCRKRYPGCANTDKVFENIDNQI